MMPILVQNDASEVEERSRFVTGGYGRHRSQWVNQALNNRAAGNVTDFQCRYAMQNRSKKRMVNTIMQRTTNENNAGLRRICKRSDQPKIKRLENNDARLILRRKLKGAAT